MPLAKGFAPGNVSCVFKIVRDCDPRRTHSLGMGFTVSEGVTATVANATAPGIRFNGQPIDFPTVRSVVEALCDIPLDVGLESPLPLSGGFGLSGASALATGYAVNALLDLGLSDRDVAMTGHVAEVTHLTGLGDIAGQFHGGCLAKLVSGDPLAAVTLPVPEQPVYYRFYAPIRTSEIIGNPEHARRINEAAGAALDRLAELREGAETRFERYIEVAKRFALASGLMVHPDVVAGVADAERAGGAASMIMLGNAVFATAPFTASQETRLSRRNAQVLGDVGTGS